MSSKASQEEHHITLAVRIKGTTVLRLQYLCTPCVAGAKDTSCTHMHGRTIRRSISISDHLSASGIKQPRTLLVMHPSISHAHALHFALLASYSNLFLICSCEPVSDLLFLYLPNNVTQPSHMLIVHFPLPVRSLRSKYFNRRRTAKRLTPGDNEREKFLDYLRKGRKGEEAFPP